MDYNYHCSRIVQPSKVMKLWPYFVRALLPIMPKETNWETLLKATCQLAGENDGFVGVVTRNNILEGFMVMEDLTPCFAESRVFECRLFWHKAGNTVATNALQNFFEEWARQNNVGEYSVTTHRHTGSSIRCFQSSKYGFKKSHFVFTKKL